MKVTRACPRVTWAPVTVVAWPGADTITTVSPGPMNGSLMLTMIGGLKGPVSLAPVAGLTNMTLKSATTVNPLPASMDLGGPLEITTSPPLGNDPAGTITVTVAPFAQPRTEPPDDLSVCVVTTVVKPSAAAEGGVEPGPYPVPSAKDGVPEMRSNRSVTRPEQKTTASQWRLWFPKKAIVKTTKTSQ